MDRVSERAMMIDGISNPQSLRIRTRTRTTSWRGFPHQLSRQSVSVSVSASAPRLLPCRRHPKRGDTSRQQPSSCASYLREKKSLKGNQKEQRKHTLKAHHKEKLPIAQSEPVSSENRQRYSHLFPILIMKHLLLSPIIHFMTMFLLPSR